MKLSTIVKDFRNRNHLSMDEMALRCGTSKPYISMLENEKNTKTGKPIQPKAVTLIKLAKGMNMTIDELVKLMDEDVVVSFTGSLRAVQIPILGRVVAGTPIEATEDILGYEEITEHMASTGEYFALRIKGDSMLPKICDGDTVIVKKQESVDNGDIAIVLVNGNDATCKKVKFNPSGITLIGYNPSVYEPHFYTSDEISSLPVKIIGKVVELRRTL